MSFKVFSFGLLLLISSFLYAEKPLISSDYSAFTEDGAEIYIRRYAQEGKPALILCPGLNQNANFWNIAGADPNFAKFFYDAGFDLWTFHYRGRGRYNKSSQSYRKINRVIVSPQTIRSLNEQTITEELEDIFRKNGHVFWKTKEVSVTTPGKDWQIKSRDQKYRLQKRWCFSQNFWSLAFLRR